MRGFAGGATTGASAADGAAAAGAGTVGASVMTPSDWSTPPLATSATGAAGGASLLDGRLARNAPAAPTVIHDAAMTATVDVLTSIAHL